MRVGHEKVLTGLIPLPRYAAHPPIGTAAVNGRANRNFHQLAHIVQLHRETLIHPNLSFVDENARKSTVLHHVRASSGLKESDVAWQRRAMPPLTATECAAAGPSPLLEP